MKYKILGVYTGKISKLPNDFVTAITKEPRDVIKVSKDWIEGNEINNLVHHGGDMRVIHHYSMANYNYLKEQFPDIADRFLPGTYGENIVTEELTERDLNIGDIYQLGTAKVQLTVSRRPCVTINHAYQDGRVQKEIVVTGRSGWYYRVLEEGEIRPGDYLEFLERPFPDLPLYKLHIQGYGEDRFADKEYLRRCLETGLMDKGWRPKIEAALV